MAGVLAFVAALDEIAIAIACLILAWAIYTLFRPLLLGALAQIPGIGSLVARTTDALLFGIWRSATPIVEAGIRPLTVLLDRSWFAVFHFRTWSLFAHDGAMFALYRLRDVTIPAARDVAIAFAQARWADGVIYTQTLYWQAINYATAQGQAAIAFAQARWADGVVYTQTLYWQSINFAVGVEQRAADFARILQGQAIQHTDAAVANAEDYARALADDGIHFTQQAVGVAEDFARQIGADAEGYARALNDLTQGYARDLVGAEAAAAAVAIAGVATAVRAIEDSPCQKFCNPLGDLGNLLQQVEDLGLAALMLALAAEMAHDPRGTARAIDGLVGDEVRGIIGTLRQESGLRGAA